jgi:hypothetical protein
MFCFNPNTRRLNVPELKRNDVGSEDDKEAKQEQEARKDKEARNDKEASRGPRRNKEGEAASFQHLEVRERDCTVKRVIDFPSPAAWDVTNQSLPCAGNNLIIPGQGEFG